MSSRGKLRDKIAEIPPLKLINWAFAALVAILLYQGIGTYSEERRKLEQIPAQTLENMLAISQQKTDNIVEIMQNPSEIYTVDPLLEAMFRDMKVRDNITAEIIGADIKTLPEELHSTPEKVEYWIKTYKGENRLSAKMVDEIRPFLPFLKAREEEEEEEDHGEGGEEEIELERELPVDEFKAKLNDIKTNFKQFKSQPIVDTYFMKDKGVIHVYAVLKRNNKKCVGCHGYMGDLPELVHFEKDMTPEIAAGKELSRAHLTEKGQDLLAVVILYLLSFVLLRGSVKKREEQSNKMENALAASVDVLKSLRAPPRMIPFFVTSPAYLTSAATGGGDSIYWIDFRYQYAGFCLHDVSGHGIQETLLNVYSTAISASCKINPANKQVNSPAQFLTRLNKKIYAFCQKTPAYKSHFLTAINILMDYTTKEMVLSLAGHPYPLLIKPDGSFEKVGKEGILIGQFKIDPDREDGYTDTSVWLGEGEILLVFSDGLMEQKDLNDVEFSSVLGKKVLPQLAGKEPGEAYRLLEQSLNEHLKGVECDDDVSFVFFGARPYGKYKTDKFLIDKKSSPGSTRFIPTGVGVGEGHDGPQSPVKRVLDNLAEELWPEQRASQVKLAFDGVLQHIVKEEEKCSGESIINITHICHNDVLELNISCDSGCQRNDPPGIRGDSVFANMSRTQLQQIRQYAGQVYFSESGDACWLLFEKKPPAK